MHSMNVRRWFAVARERLGRAHLKTCPISDPLKSVGIAADWSVVSTTWRAQLQLAVERMHQATPAEVAEIGVFHKVESLEEAGRVAELGRWLAAEYGLRADTVLAGSRLTVRFTRPRST